MDSSAGFECWCCLLVVLSEKNSNSSTMVNLALVGKRALVTGGSGTIGQAIARILFHNGASVVLTARNLDRLQKAASAIDTAPASSSSIECISCDVTVESSVTELFETCFTKQRIDLLINNAGVIIPGAAADLSAAGFEKAMQVNVTGPFLCSREAMKRMQTKDEDGKPFGGRIINIGSLSAHSPRPDSCSYTTSKFALQGLTHSLAIDGRAHGITVGIIHPGNVMSDLLTEEMILERKDTEGFLETQDVAECVLTMATMPPTANVLEMTILPTKQPYMGRG